MIRAFYTERGTQHQSEAVRDLLRRVMHSELGIEMPEIAKTEKGKPYFPGRPDIHFSLSHSKNYVMCAVSDRPVGVDMEEERAVRTGVPERVCTNKELGEFDFFELWVLKESFIKLRGGLEANLRDIEFARAGGMVHAPDGSVCAALYEPRPGVHAAVCCTGEAPAKIEYVACGQHIC